MALVQQRLKGKIKAAFQQDASSDNIDAVADKIADAVIGEIKQLTITYVAGLTTAPGGGPVTGTFQFTLS